jgi:hypothetical protein
MSALPWLVVVAKGEQQVARAVEAPLKGAGCAVLQPGPQPEVQLLFADLS